MPKSLKQITNRFHVNVNKFIAGKAKLRTKLAGATTKITLRDSCSMNLYAIKKIASTRANDGSRTGRNENAKISTELPFPNFGM